MTRQVTVLRGGPHLSVQDGGRKGGLAIGLSRSGAADRQAYLAGLALLEQSGGQASIELAGLGGKFRFEAATRFALTGAEMRAFLDGEPVESQASHLAGPGSVLEIAALTSGVYGYLALAGGIGTEPEYGGRGYHRIGGFGRPLVDGSQLPIGEDKNLSAPPKRLSLPRSTGAILVMPGPQTGLFSQEARKAFETTTFTRSTRANRQGVRLEHQGAPFSTGGQLNQVSDFICEGDIQMTGDGTPYVLLADCQTIGGYPRIGTVLPADLPRIAQAIAGEELSFRFVSLEEAEASWISDDALLAELRNRCELRVRDPREMANLLSFELIDRPGDEVTEP